MSVSLFYDIAFVWWEMLEAQRRWRWGCFHEVSPGRTEREHPSALTSSGAIRSTQGGQLEATRAEPGQMLCTANVQPGVQSSYFTDVDVLTAETGSQLLYPGGMKGITVMKAGR